MEVRNLNTEEWHNYVRQCPQATFFHTPMWYAVWDAYAKNRSLALLFEFPSGRTALLPLSEKKIHKGLTRVYDSSPAGTYGGFISPTSLKANEVSELLTYVKKMTINIAFNPYQPLDGLSTVKTDFTQRINLELGIDVNKWHRYSGRMKKSKNLTVKQGENISDWKLYFSLYQKSLVRWGDSVSSEYSFSLFEQLEQLPKDMCRLFLVYDGDAVIYGGIFFLYNKMMIYWHGAGDERFFKKQPAFLLQKKGIDFAIKNGFRYYDFNPSGGHQGVEKFKNNFKPEIVYFPILFNQNAWYSSLDGLSKILKSN